MYFTKPIFILFFGTGLLTIQSQITLAQESETAYRNQQPISAEIVSQINCPLLISIRSLENKDNVLQTVYYSIQNNSHKPVYLYTNVGSIKGVEKSFSTHFYKLFQPQEIRYEKYEIERAKVKSDSKVFLSIDYVLFADGSSWGNDENKTYERIVTQFVGKKAAIEYFKKFIENNDREVLLNILEQNIDNFQIPIPGTNMSETAQKSFQIGYKSIFYVLQKNKDLNSELLLKSLDPIIKNFGLQNLPNTEFN